MQIDQSGFQERVLQLKQKYPRLRIASGTIDKRARTHFFISANGEVYTFDSGALSTIIIGDVRTHTIAELAASPALKQAFPEVLAHISAQPPEAAMQSTTSNLRRRRGRASRFADQIGHDPQRPDGSVR